MAPQKNKIAAGKKARPAGKSEGALRRAEHRVEEVVKDVVAEVENRVILAGEAADESTSSEVNILSAVEVAIHPPHGDDKPPAASKAKKNP
jgi:hypothetical protein